MPVSTMLPPKVNSSGLSVRARRAVQVPAGGFAEDLVATAHFPDWLPLPMTEEEHGRNHQHENRGDKERDM